MLKLLHLPAADMKSEMELRRAAAPQLRKGKSSGAPRRSGRLAFSSPSLGNSRGLLATGVVTPHCKIQTKGAAERHRGWRRINEQTKQTTHRSSPKLTAKQVVNNLPVGAALAPQEQEQEHRGQRGPTNTFFWFALEAAGTSWSNWWPVFQLPPPPGRAAQGLTSRFSINHAELSACGWFGSSIIW